MPIESTISALACVPFCDTLTELDDAQFYAVLIDKLATAADVDLADITAQQLTAAVETVRCDLQGRTAFSEVEPQRLKAIVLHLLAQL
jgi:hypothetical protein